MEENAQPDAHLEPVNEFESLYLKERRKSRWLMGASAALSVLLVVSLSLFILERNKQPEPLRPFAAGAGPGAGQSRGGFSGISIKDFFNSDGSVNEDQIEQITSGLPSQMRGAFLNRIAQQIDSALSSGEISQSQAQDLRETLDIGGEGQI